MIDSRSKDSHNDLSLYGSVMTWPSFVDVYIPSEIALKCLLCLSLYMNLMT